ncbi:transmembrane [Cystoisospora suis]|uniref:Transmembrane n=1 Tax=Cystoisospora suis TaxID=483139 RepID=A0A2C6LH62_9APIC|nr:transmembrane [Cystoisospora suis]
MNDVYFSGLFTWSSLFFSLMCNFIAPIGVYILACTKIPPLQRNLQGKRGKILFNPQLRRNVQGLGGGQRTAEQVRLSLLQWLRSTLKDEARTGECDPQLLHLLLSPSTPSSAAQLDSGAPGNGESSPYEDGGTDILDSLTHHRSAWLREEAATAAVAAAALQIRDGFLPAGPYRKPRSPLSSLGGSLSILPSSDDSGTTGSAGSAGENSPRASFASPTPFSPKSHGHSQHLSPASSIQTLPGDLRSSSSSQLPLCSRSHSLVSGHSAKASTAEELPSARRAASMTHSDKRRTRRHSFKSFLSVDRGKGKLSYTSSPSDGGSSTPSLAPPGGLSREEEFNQNTRTDEAMGSPLHRTWDRAALDEVGLRLKQLAASGQEGEERGEEEEEERGGDSRISRDRVAGSPVSHSPSTLSVSKGGDMGTSGNRANDGRTHPGNGFGSPPRRRATGSSTGSRETSDGRRYLKECLPYPTPYREESEYHHTLSKEDSRALGRDGCFPVPSVGSRNARMLRFHPGYTTARAAEEERGGLGGEVNLYRHSSPSESEEEVAECVSRDVDDDAAAIRAQLQLPQLLLLHADEVEKNVWLLPPEYEDQSVSVKREDSRSEGWNGGEERRGGVGGYAQPGEYSWQHESGQETSEGIGQTGEPSGEQRRPEGGLLEENKTLEILSSAQAAAREKTSRGRRTARWSPTDKAVAFHDETLETKALFHPESRRLEPGETVTSESEEASHTFQGDSHRRKQTFSGATVPLARRGGHAQGSRVSDTTVAEVSPRSHVPATSEFVSPLSGDVRSSSRSGSDFAGSASHASFSLPPGAEAGAGTAPKDASLNEGMSFAENAGFRSSYGRRRSRRLDSSVRASSAGSFSFSNPPSFWHSSTSVHTTAPLVSLSSALSCPLSAPVDRTIRSAPRRPPESGHKFDRAQSCGGPGAFGWARSMTPDPSSLLPRSGGHKLLSATSGHFASSHTCGGGAGSSRLLPREDSVERLGIGKLGKEVLLRQQRQWLAAQQASSASRQRRLLSRRHTLSGRLLGGFSRQVSSFPLRRGRTGLDETFSSRRLRPSRTVAPEVDSLFSCCSNNFSEAFLAAEGLEAPLLLRQLKERKKQEKDAHAEERRSLQEAQQGVPGIVSSQDCRSKPIRSLTLGDPAFLVESRRSSRTGWRRETGLRSVGLPDLVPGPPKLRRSLTVFGGAGQQYTQGSSKLARAAAKAARELVSFAPKLILGTSQRERSRPLEEQNAETGILEGTPGATRLRAGAQTEDGEKGPAYKENTLLRRAETTSWDMFRRRNDEPEKERCVRVLMETGEKTARAEGERRGTERERREEESPRSRNKHQGNNNNAEEKKQAESVLESPLSCSLYSSLGSEDERGPRNSSEDVASPCPLFCYSNHAVEQLSSSSAKPSIASAPAAFSASLSSSKSPSSSSLYYSPMSSVTGDSRLGTVRPSPPLALSSLPVDGEESSVLHFTELPGNITPDSQDRLPCGSCSLPAFPLSSSSSSQPATGDAGDRSPSSVSPSPKVVLPGSRLAPEERGGNGDSLLSVSFQQGVEKAREQKTAGDVSPRVSARVIENKADDKEDVLGLRKTPLSSEAVKERGSFGHDKNIDSTIEKGGQGVGAAHAASEETNLESSEPPSCRSEKIEGGEQPVPTSQGSSRSTSRFAPGGTLASVLKAPSLSRFPFSGSQSPDFVRSYQGLHGQEWKSKAAPLLSSEPEFDVLRSPPLSHGDEKPRGGADASGAAGSSRLGESSSQYSTQAGEHTAGKSGVRSPEQETGVNPPAALVLPSTAEGQQDAAQQQEESTPRRSLIFREPEKETKSVRAPGEFQRRRGKTASVCMPAWNSPSSRYGQAASQEDQEEKAEGRRQSGNNTDIHASLPTIQVTFADDPAALSGYEDALAVDEDVLTGDLLPIKIHVYPTAFLRNKHIELSIGLLASLLLCAAVSLTYQVFYGED